MSAVLKIVVVGGGAGGLELVTALGNRLGKPGKASIVLVDESPTHLWKPLLHEVAAGTLNSNEDELNYIAHAYAHHYQFQQGRMIGISRKDKKVLLAPIYDNEGREIIPARDLKYDFLVIAVGSEANDFNTKGVPENCLFLDKRAQADRFQQQFLANLLQAQYQSGPVTRGQLDIAIVGAGATGVELAAELRDTVRQAVSYGLDKIDPEQDVKITLLEAAPRILPALPERISKAVNEVLQNSGIQMVVGEMVTEVTEQGLHTNTGRFIPAALKIWAAGIKAPAFLANLDGLEVNKLNQLLVKPTLQTTLDETIFAIGDCASCPQPNSEKSVPPRAQAAHQQAILLTKSFIRKLNNESLLNFDYRDYGSLVTLSRHDTLGNLMGGKFVSITIEGKLARLVYLSLYKKHQVSLHGWWRVFLSTLANLLTRKNKPRLKLH